MKKLLFTAIFFLIAVAFNDIKAQTTGTSVLSIELNAAQSITVNEPTVALTMSSSDHYLNGVAVDQPNHLTFASTSGFLITAKGTNLTGGTGGDIPIENISITPTQGTKTSSGILKTSTSLALADKEIYSSKSVSAGAGGTTQANLSVNYKAVGGTSFLNRTGTYTSTITYTIAPN